ncbi:M48 family metallopeptidase [Nannocystis bainbridge]|uniref:M48 family metallopeptidase n=1 Tax=Nannocystis bainbridge TaxID=2995303 RepID=A0ABT5E628_9BACT|nr:M48 family metallopeptidase [Nannocystis bainbridge]MDC0721309.1 M48 family metallopeptidase [Nannocystis bainbridge]
MRIDPRQFQVRREQQLRDDVMQDFGVRKALAKLREWRGGKGYGYRRNLLSSTLRLTRSMSPEIADTVTQCKEMLGYETPVEVYVTPEHQFNATCYREIKGPTILTLSSRLLEVFTPAELRFVIGHELGHAVFDHYGLPMPITATIEELGIPFVSRATSLRLYAWCRSAELSADRIGLLCAGDPEAAASGFFKLASGMASERVRPDLATFARQVESLASAPEAREKEYDEDTLDCFSTHPYNPVRVRAVWAFSRSEPYLQALGRSTDSAWQLEDVEQVIERDLQLMEPSYLEEKSQTSDTLRRLLYTAGLAVAAASGGVEPAELDALGRLLGSDHADEPADIPKLLGDLDGRIQAALEVPLRNRAQLVQHLTIVAAADGSVSDEELHVMEDIARRLEVGAQVVHQTIRGAMHPLD